MDGNFRIVIAGGGRVGNRVAHILDDRGHDVTVIEQDPNRAEALSDDYVATVIEGDATRPGVLEQADLERADVVAALTSLTGTNLAVCLLVRELAPDTQTVARTEREPGEEFDRFVDEVIFPERAGARAAVNAIEPDVSALEDVTGTLDILEVHVVEGAPVAGRSLDEVSLPRGSLVVSDAAGDTLAGPETVLRPGESYLVAVEPSVVDEVLNLFRG
ncbi:potassium channel family protein [Halorubrum halodurans]|uniref:Potassium transporter Trk n=1 Tax=Halorubrum halodurans TaxID=1383851 RepID=A0A256ILQ8_9EURY|nr:TrkA family potassium uptake protein [Halorubrum halodurans]OYR57451.1 potassium transporter Trk [Halorubrum halodurans]